MRSGTLTLGVDSVTVIRGSLRGHGREFALVSWLLRNVTDHRVNQGTPSHLPKGRFSYPRRAFSLSDECGEQVPLIAAPACKRVATP